MILNLIDQVNSFLKKNLIGNGPLLLGFSGGSDSLALVHILLTLKPQFGFDLHLAHMDHGWREESAKEAEVLKGKAKEWGVPFHCKRISPDALKGNLEAASRVERLKFFSEIYQSQRCQALILAHHSQDQMETVLKRILEGLSLPYLAGMSPIKTLMGMEIWRPLLKVSKEDIQNYLDAFNLHPLEDRTNLDPKYLRARMRSEIVPSLNKSFGKEILPGLSRIATEASDLKDFLDGHLEVYIKRIEHNPHGAFLDLSQQCPKSFFEIKYLLRKLAESKGYSLPHSIVDQGAELILTGAADKKIAAKAPLIEIDRRRIFLFSAPFPDLKFSFEESTDKSRTSWKEAWKGTCSVLLPPGEYRVGKPLLNARFLNGPNLGKWWTDNKVPAFLRGLMPVIYSGDLIVHEFLTGKLQAPYTNSGTRISSNPIYDHPISKIPVECE